MSEPRTSWSASSRKNAAGPKSFPASAGECLKLVFGTLWRASERWRRVRFSELERRQIERYKQDRQAERQKAGQTRQATVA